MPVVRAEADRQNVGSVSNKAASGETGVEVPEPEGVVPGGRQRELAIRRDDDVGDEVVVSVKDALRVAVRLLLAGELPDDNGLVCITRF